MRILFHNYRGRKLNISQFCSTSAVKMSLSKFVDVGKGICNQITS